MQTKTCFSETHNLTDSNLGCYCDSPVYYFSTWKLRVNSGCFCSQLIRAAERKRMVPPEFLQDATLISQFHVHCFWEFRTSLTIYYSLQKAHICTPLKAELISARILWKLDFLYLGSENNLQRAKVLNTLVGV